MTEQSAAPAVPEFELSDRLRRALRHADVGSNEMAEYLEVSRHTISNWINGRTRPPATAVKLWAMRCGVDYRWLVSGVERPVASDYGPPSDFMLNADIPSGMSVDQTVPPTRAEILAHRKAFRLRYTTDARFARTGAAS